MLDIMTAGLVVSPLGYDPAYLKTVIPLGKQEITIAAPEGPKGRGSLQKGT